jgi:hypothetical protein
VIRGLAHDGERPVVMLGLDAENLDRLREGQPITVNLRRLNPTGGVEVTELPDVDVVIFYAGKDEVAKLMARFRGRR